MQDQVAVDLQHDESQAGDVYVLCSDGLSGMVTDEEILAIVAAAHPNAMQEAPKKLIERANERGGEDNVTAVVIAIEDDAIESTGQAKAVTEEVAGAMSQRSANAPTEVPPPGSQDASQLPPVNVEKKTSAEFTDEPTLPAIDIRKSEPSSLGEEPTLPAIDLTKELAAIKKQRGE